MLDMLEARVAGDYLQTAAIFDESMHVLSLVTDPNDYAGPAPATSPTPERQAEIDAVRQQRSVDDLRRRAGAAPLRRARAGARPGCSRAATRARS